MVIADGFVFKFVWDDFQATRKQEGYDQLSIWSRLRFNMTFFFILTALVSLAVFLGYFIISNLSIA
jgi:hypothetical protein